MPFRKTPTQQHDDPTVAIFSSPPIFENALPELFSAHAKKRRDRMGGVVYETLKQPRFLLRVSGFSILKKLPDNSQLHAGATSEVGPIECRALLDLDLAC